MNMKWFLERPKIVIVAAAIVLLFILLIVSTQTDRMNNPLGNGIRTVVSAIQKPFVGGMDYLFVKGTSSMSDEALLSENEKLKSEVSDLQNELIKSRLDNSELEELRNLALSLGTQSLTEMYTLRASNIISFNENHNVNMFTIDVGTEDGVHRDTIVVNGDGLIGRVVDAGIGTATVLCIIDETNKVGFEIDNGKGFIGVSQGSGDGKIKGEMLDPDATVEVGDKVITSGMGGIYPQGIVIGTISKKEYTDENALLSVEIEPAVYFMGLKKVALLL